MDIRSELRRLRGIAVAALFAVLTVGFAFGAAVMKFIGCPC